MALASPDLKLEQLTRASIQQPLLGDQLQTIKHPPISHGIKERLKPFQKYCR